MSTPFCFKQFAVAHDKSSMKVGTDAILLGAWTDVLGGERVLDIGAGCGVIGLMLVQRGAGQVDCVELDGASCAQSRENVAQSPWPTRLAVWETPIQQFISEPYDLIVSNPPFFVNSLSPQTRARAQARHTESSLSYEALLLSVWRLLKKNGRFSTILPVDTTDSFITLANERHLYCVKQTAVRPLPHKPIRRNLLTFSKTEQSIVKDELLLEHVHIEKQSEAFIELTKEFYLDF